MLTFPLQALQVLSYFQFCRKSFHDYKLGLHIMTVTCDGASEKKLLFSLYDENNDKIAYKIKNVYTNAGHLIFFHI